MSGSEEPSHGDRFSVDGVQLYSLHQINALDPPLKRAIYCRLLPMKLLADYGIDPETLCDDEGNELVRFTFAEGSRTVEIDVRPEADFPDPLLYLELTDTRLNQIEVLLFAVNDPQAERFETDRDWRGQRTKFGTLRRNIPEEIRAMKAGLAPGQVRKGLRLSRTLLPLFEEFVECLGHDYYLMEPLAYHNAILFERLGFNYVQGRRKMQWIHLGFQPEGLLYGKLDGSTPFLHPDAWQTIRGRSWAIHDGILGEPWHGIKMYKRVGRHAGVDTFPGGEY
ncbi:MAG: hypothetical protein PVI80_02965 [Anaerolineae bacterium]|jgi:hypothetical protein